MLTYYKWPFANSKQPHTVIVRHDKEAETWEVSVCGETEYLRMVAGQEPEFVKDVAGKRIIKSALEPLDS